MLSLPKGDLRLPDFGTHRYAGILDRLHREVLVCVREGVPLPNPLVYRKPWHRDAALMAMVMRITGNLPLIRDWVMSLEDPFDRNNQGIEEPDNLGQCLFLASLFEGKSMKVVGAVQNQMGRFTHGGHLIGLTDFAEHPVYQTRWMKYGLRAIGLEDRYVVPKVGDTYAALFWMDGQAPNESAQTHFQGCVDYPYLGWAEAHTNRLPPPMNLLGRVSSVGEESRQSFESDHWLTWEANASQAEYDAMAVIEDRYVRERRCVPHAWHAAEAFLYLYELG